MVTGEQKELLIPTTNNDNHSTKNMLHLVLCNRCIRSLPFPKKTLWPYPVLSVPGLWLQLQPANQHQLLSLQLHHLQLWSEAESLDMVAYHTSLWWQMISSTDKMITGSSKIKCLGNNLPQQQTDYPGSEPGLCSDNLATSHLRYDTVQATPHCFLTHDKTWMQTFKYNQQDATLYSILYYCQCSTCFRRFHRPSSGAQNCTHSIWYMSSLLAATTSVGEVELTHTSSSRKQAWHIPDAVCTVLSSWWWVEKLPETRRALTVIKNIV